MIDGKNKYHNNDNILFQEIFYLKSISLFYLAKIIKNL